MTIFGGLTLAVCQTLIQLLSYSPASTGQREKNKVLLQILHRLQSGYLLWHSTPCQQGNSLLHHDPPHRLQRKLCSGAGSNSFPFFTDLGVSRVVSHIFAHSYLSQMLCNIFYPFLSMLSQMDISSADEVNFEQRRVNFGASWNQACPTWGLPLLTTQRGHPCRPLATKTLQHNSSTLSGKVVFCSNIQVSYKRKPYEFICTCSKL